VTLGFSSELLAAVLLATLTAAIVSADPDLGRSLVRRTLRLAVQGIALLCVLGLIFRSGWTPTDTGGARFSWPGAYPLPAAAEIAVTVVVLVGSFGGPIAQYLCRGESQQQVLGLNGRVGLWTIGLQQLHSPGRWLVGYGLNGTRVIFASTTAWAGDAHSAWIE